MTKIYLWVRSAMKHVNSEVFREDKYYCCWTQGRVCLACLVVLRVETELLYKIQLYVTTMMPELRGISYEKSEVVALLTP